MCMEKLNDLELSLREVIYMARRTRDLLRTAVAKRSTSFAAEHSMTPNMVESEVEMRMSSMIDAVEHLAEADRLFIIASDRIEEYLR